MNYFALQKAARILGVGLNDINTKKELILKLEKENFTFEQYEFALKETGKAQDAIKNIKTPIPIVDETKSDVITEKTNEKMLVTMGILRGAYKVKSHIFTLEQPYKLLPKHEALSLIETSKGNLRKAEPEEVAAYYGVEDK